MEFVTEAWHPVNMTKIRLDRASDASSLRTYEMRHWMFVVGVAMLALAPIVAVASGNWVSAPLLGGLGLFLVSVATLIVPEAELEEYESGEDRRDT